ncbi:sugar phosphate isomerase/epimerase family protein [Novipirellula artificiosorum]|uniref:Xylose isomerase-like TIM barrel n=1 Tax=Novipirellula artificiosorum TaxID=2528016 RepID=A0A5C6D7Y3_9BACT|nr:sugar phosphate isomerase/epimerase family protein [Novipirellula artificiosorum]TWU31827.1 Xylose isomerase-like TIM barrel [Novipirellula artificiosorum]
MMNNRREFLLAASSFVAAPLVAHAATPQQSKQPFCVFTKPFNSLSFDELAERIAELGFDGIEAPIRRGGHVDPVKVEDELPKLVEALRQRDLEITVMTSDLNDPNDPVTTRVLRTAASLGIKRYRMQYFKYNLNTSVLDQIAEWKPQLRDLAAINHDLGIQGLYQNHAGTNYMGAPLWDLRLALEGISADDIGVAYDIRHATAEGGASWPATFNMIRPLIKTVYVKDFAWGDNGTINTPLGEGRVDAKFFKMLRDSGFNGPISLHEEYLDHRVPELVPEHLAAIKKDFETLKQWM